jgi:hypothetical protein
LLLLHRLTQGVLSILRLCSGLLRLAQALLRNAHPQLRLKQQLLTSQTKTEPAKGKTNPESMGIVSVLRVLEKFQMPQELDWLMGLDLLRAETTVLER